METIKITRNYALSFTEKEIDMLVENLPMLAQSFGYAFDKNESLKDKIELSANTQHIATIMKKIADAVEKKENEIEATKTIN